MSVSKAYFPSILEANFDKSTAEDGGQNKSLVDPKALDNFILNSVLPVSMAGSVNHESLNRLQEEEMMSGPNMRFQLNLEILTGSTGEGLSLPEITEMKGPLKHFTYAADSDIKYVLTSLIVDSQNKKAFSRMDLSVSPPGFTRLKFNPDWMKQRKTGTARFTEARERQVLASPADFTNNDGFVIRRKITGILRKEMKEHVHSIDKEIRQMNLAKGTIPKISFSQHGPAITANMVNPVSKMVASKIMS